MLKLGPEGLSLFQLALETRGARSGLDFFESHLAEAQAEIAEAVRRAKEELSPVEGFRAETDLLQDGYSVSVSFPQTLRRSIFLSGFADFEVYMEREAGLEGQRRHIASKPSDLTRDKGIARSRKYLVKEIGFPFPDADPAWQRILKYRALRHQLMHGGPRLPTSDKKKLEEAFRNIPNVAVKAGENVIMNPGFVEASLWDYEVFGRQLRTLLSAVAIPESSGER